MKQVLITGGSGLIGTALTRSLCRQGHHVTILSRKPAATARNFTDSVTTVADLSGLAGSRKFHWVVNLAGAQIVGKRWTESTKKTIWQSRMDTTRNLVDFISRLPIAPEVLVSGSAIGYYGNCEDRQITESAPPSDDFGARLCVEWEQQALRARQFDIRVCLARTGLVLSPQGGILGKMLLPFRLGLGGKLGSGEQWMSWIHIADHVAAIHHLLESQDAEGPYNLTAPTAVTNQQFTETLAGVLNRPSFLGVPGAVIRLGLGEAGELLLGGQNVLPEKLLQSGFRFRYPLLADALRQLLKR